MDRAFFTVAWYATGNATFRESEHDLRHYMWQWYLWVDNKRYWREEWNTA